MVSLGLAFAIGLGADVIHGVMLGEQALRLTVLVFIVLRFRARLRFFPMWQQALAVLALLLNDRIIELALRSFAGTSGPAAVVLAGAASWARWCGRSCSCCSTTCARACAPTRHDPAGSQPDAA